jgi:hypothetical protein
VGVQKTGSLLATVAALMLAGGCKTAYYTLELSPEGARMERSVSTWVGPEGMERVYAAYGLEPDPETIAAFEKEDLVEIFLSSTFDGTMPDDIGNRGYLMHYESPLGNSSLYTEKFRGYDNLADTLDMQEQAFHRAADLVLLWLDLAISETDQYPEFRHFVDTTFRNDMRNLVLLVNTTDTVGRSVTFAEGGFEELFGASVMMRSLHFLAERNYFDLTDFPALLDQLDTFDETEILQFVAETITRRMGLTDVPPPLQHLIDTPLEDLEAAHERYLKSAELAEMIESWNSGPYLRMRYDLDDDDSMEQFQTQFLGIEFDLFGTSGSDVLNVTMALPIEPYETNGSWDDSGKVFWEQHLASRDPFEADLPNVLHSAWSEPEVELQESYFGIVALSGEDLFDYCRWWNGLDVDRQTEWKAFLETLEPGTELLIALRQFKFTDETGKQSLQGKHDYRSRVARSVLFDIERALEAAERENE